MENVFFSEVIFGIHNSLRKEVNKTLFTADEDQSLQMTGGRAFVGSLYGITAGSLGGEDPGVRTRVWSYSTLYSAYEFVRYATNGNPAASPYRNEIMCLFRLGELYLIAAETAPDVETKRSWLEALRLNRGYDAGNADGLTEDQLNQLIAVEYEKETYGEGQYFFFAKRRAENLRTQSNTAYPMSKAEYVPPLPEDETNYRERQE
ncbi:MAG: hypothetical protein LUD68_08105 [Rikenellaceae bacterium]|nr:hypothetical protein [Rikenellaceae bacterium]